MSRSTKSPAAARSRVGPRLAAVSVFAIVLPNEPPGRPGPIASEQAAPPGAGTWDERACVCLTTSKPPPPQSPYGAQGAQGTPPSNYLVWAILTTIFCCLPLGIASIVFSTQVNSKWALGDVAGAQDSSEKAKKFAIWSAIAWAVIAVIYAIALAVGLANFNFSTSNSSGF